LLLDFHGPFRQTERQAIYRAKAGQLLKEGKGELIEECKGAGL